MIVVKIELWPHGDREQAKPLGAIVIANDGTGNETHGNYDVQLTHAGRYFGRRGAWKTGRVERHYRELSPYHLVLKAVQACIGNA